MSTSIMMMSAVFGGAYLLASIPFGLVITRLMGLGDLRKIGSGNIGATNVLRTGSKLAAALTLILDIGKGAIAVLITMFIFREHELMPVMMAIAAAASVIGHCFPVWLRFHGGKGVATGIGVIMALNPLAGFGMIASWLVAFKIINPWQPFVRMILQLLGNLHEPLLMRIRSVLPQLGGLDISPIIILLAVQFLRNLLFEYLG